MTNETPPQMAPTTGPEYWRKQHHRLPSVLREHVTGVLVCEAEPHVIADAVSAVEEAANLIETLLAPPQMAVTVEPKPAKTSHVGAPAIFLLERECRTLNEAFGGHGCYLVGSALERPDWRDVDIRFIMDDDEFAALFPDADQHWEFDARWLIMTTSISAHLSRASGLPVDFQFQPRTHANERHKGPRNAMGMNFAKEDSA